MILDFWTGQKDDLLFESMTGTKKCNRLQIPPKATQYIQPLDVYGFRQWKIFDRKITDFIELHNINVDINNRLNIITMHSLIHYQLSSPKFQKMWQYSWYKSRYTNTHPGNTIQFRFKMKRYEWIVKGRFYRWQQQNIHNLRFF